MTVLADLIARAGSPVALLYAFGLSLSGLGIAVEWAAGALTGRRGLYGARDTLANLALYAGFFGLNLWWADQVFRIYVWTSDHAIAHLTLGGFHLGQHGLWREWLALFVLEDLCFYTFHRVSHRCRLYWASHVTHHSSAHFNLSVAFRQTWVPFLGVVFWLPLLLIGFDPLMVMSMQVVSLFYQELLHSQMLPSLGPVELIFNTPRHHALHHGSNAPYLDKNYGGVLIVWDRLFGTFAARRPDEPVRFGLTHPLRSSSPVVIALHEWGAMVRGLLRARSLGTWLTELLGPPERSLPASAPVGGDPTHSRRARPR